MKPLTLAAALLFATVSSSSWAQAPADHELHHPDQKETQPTPSPGQSGMVGPGMMGGKDIMDNSMPNMMQMMGMMGRQGADTGCAGMSGMATIDHVEGRIAFLRSELKITDAQTSAWSAFADTLRANAKSLAEVRASMMPQQGTTPQTLIDRLTLQEKWLSARLEGTRAIKSALNNLTASFSDDQKKAADELLAPHMGMMGMMAAIRSGQMGPGQMQPGMMMPGR
jgi:LTXXQ motif family protein